MFGGDGTPEVSVVVASHDRPARLAALLEALRAQALGRDAFEVVVVDDGSAPGTAAVLDAERNRGELDLVVLRHERARGPAAARNAGWRRARASLIAFTDDDCRPPPNWLGGALAAAARNPGAIVQGATLPDPDERVNLRAPFVETQHLVPPTIWAETCNILYPREVLQRVDGLDETLLLAFEDTDLALRAQERGVPFVGAREVVTYHAVHTSSLARKLRGVGRWRDGPATVKRHPGLRESLPLGIFWKPTHAWLPLAVLGLALESRRHRGAVLLGLPWAVHHLATYGRSPRGRLRSVAELPAQGAIDLGEMIVLLRASIRHRTVLL
jgi:GT2 family glycosyltransferase